MKQGRAQTTGSNSFHVSPWCRLVTAVLACRWLMAVSCCGYFKGTALQLKRVLSMPRARWPSGHFHASPWLYQSSGFGWNSSQTKPPGWGWYGLRRSEEEQTPHAPVIKWFIAPPRPVMDAIALWLGLIQPRVEKLLFVWLQSKYITLTLGSWIL